MVVHTGAPDVQTMVACVHEPASAQPLPAAHSVQTPDPLHTPPSQEEPTVVGSGPVAMQLEPSAAQTVAPIWHAPGTHRTLPTQPPSA
jgi:hypothetical protein